MCRILINQTMGCIADDLTLENGDKPRSAGRKPAERETPQKPSRGGKRPGAGRPSLGLAPTSAAVADPVADQSVINQKRVGDAAQSLINQKRVGGGDKRGGARRGAGRKTAEQETRLRGKPAAAPPSAPTVPPAPTELPAQTPEEYLGVIMSDPENPLQTRMDAAELLMRYGRGPGRGKKAAAEEAARIASRGRFATPPGPTLVINNDDR